MISIININPFFFPLWIVSPKEFQLFCSFQMTLYKNRAIDIGILDVHDTLLVHSVCSEVFLWYTTLEINKSGECKRWTHTYAFPSIINTKIRPLVVQRYTYVSTKVLLKYTNVHLSHLAGLNTFPLENIILFKYIFNIKTQRKQKYF